VPLYDPAKRPSKRPVRTEDGSVTLYSEEFGECYHSTRDGALRESLAKHVRPAFALLEPREEVAILDICFGLGYNTLATLLHLQSLDTPPRLRIYAPELDRELVASLATFDYPDAFAGLLPVVEALGRTGRYEDERIRIEVLFGDAREIVRTLDGPVDLVYQDAFSPAKNPLLWTREWFADLRALCRDDAILTTYSVAASTRMGLHENGFLLYEYRPEGARKSLIASPTPLRSPLEGLTPIDMELKMKRNPDASSLRDGEFGGEVTGNR
jgi:tRNA U34 5-methylaminomethyl-2-thiouridine-forming methyltransferase MnmC